MKSVFKEFVANFKHFKSAYIINILGLAIAIAVFTGIMLQLIFELGYDKFRPNAKNIYRIECFNTFDQKGYSSGAYTPLGDLLTNQCPEVAGYFSLKSQGENIFIIQKNKNKFKESLFGANPAMIDILSFDIIDGDGKKALTEPNLIMIPESIARKWFGKKPALQQTVKTNWEETYTVGAIYKDFPANSNFQNTCYTKFIPHPMLKWNGRDSETFLQISTNDIQQLTDKINNLKIEELEKNENNQPHFRLTKLTDIYYDNSITEHTREKGNVANSILLFAIAVIILLIAVINFINFSMSLTPTRIKKINTHRILGANLLSLRIKLIAENLLYWGGAFLLALFMLQLFSVTSSNLLTVSVSPLVNSFTIVYIGITLFILGIFSAIYPTWYTTSLPLSLVIKGNFILTPQGKKVRNGLLGFQIFTSILLTIATIVVISQNRFLQNYNIGISTTDIAYFRTNHTLLNKKNVLIDELKKIPEVTDYTFTNWIPGVKTHARQAVTLDEENFNAIRCDAAPNFLNFFNISIVKGNPSSEYADQQVFFNETSAKQHPIIERSIGKEYKFGTLTGIVKDFHCTSMHQILAPTYFVMSDGSYASYYTFIKLAGDHKTKTIEKLRSIFLYLSPNEIFDFQFLDKAIQQRYETEQRLAKLTTILGITAFLLALTGVYSLIVFNTQYKRQEIAIRKINGAMENEIILWLNHKFVRIVIISFLISCPIAYWICYKWLEGFIYKTAIHWWFFAIAGLGTLVLVIITVSWRSWKAASANPIESLKNE